MHKLLLAASPVIFALALSGCGKSGPGVKQVAPPRLAEVPPSLMQKPQHESGLRRRLLESDEAPTTGSNDSKTSSEQTERDKALSQFAKDLAELHQALVKGWQGMTR